MHLIDSTERFEYSYTMMSKDLIASPAVNRGPAHAMKSDETSMVHELLGITLRFGVPRNQSVWARTCSPNLPWAEDHFRERIGGDPLNPAPSEAWWPFAQAGNAEHKSEDEKFSHTYPERFWPKFAAAGDPDIPGVDFPSQGRQGIRFLYGDLNQLVDVLRRNSNSRQAYLPIWFPEDLTAADRGERVPCSLGYYFLRHPGRDQLDCTYYMRSCDIMRFYRDDVYMAGRLLQHVAKRTHQEPGQLTIHVANLHCFPNDLGLLLHRIHNNPNTMDIRSTYNFGALG